MSNIELKLTQAQDILTDLGMPRAQLNERTALCLLALLNLQPAKTWAEIEQPLIGITPIMDWSKEQYDKSYAPNTREPFRRQSIHQFIEAGICLINPDKPDRSVNSPKTVYKIEPTLFELLKTYNTENYQANLEKYLKGRQSLSEKYARERDMNLLPVKLKDGKEIKLSAGEHSELIRDIVENFASRFAPASDLVYVGDTGDKYGYFDIVLLKSLGIELDSHGKLPDVIIYFREKNWLLLIESVTSHGPVDAKRYSELTNLFGKSSAGLVFVSAFPNRKVFLRFLEAIAWETEVWIADSPTHMIHFNGERFLGPYQTTS